MQNYFSLCVSSHYFWWKKICNDVAYCYLYWFYPPWPKSPINQILNVFIYHIVFSVSGHTILKTLWNCSFYRKLPVGIRYEPPLKENTWTVSTLMIFIRIFLYKIITFVFCQKHMLRKGYRSRYLKGQNIENE